MSFARTLICFAILLPCLGLSQDITEKTQEIAQKLWPSLVRIHVVESDVSGGREMRTESFGSGVILSSDGYVVTNHHVAGKAIWLSVTLSDKSEVDAKLIGTDPLSDIAVIQLAPRADGRSYPAAKWGDSAKLTIGQRVLALGSPFAFSQSVTSGIVSNTELIMPSFMRQGGGDFELDGEDVGSIVRWIGHDAQIFPGNSGGPLINLKGEVVGINEISMGLGGAIPANLAHSVFEQIVKTGHVTRTFTGITLQPRLTVGTATRGALVSDVYPDSPASKAGIEPGDLLLSVGEVKFDTRYPEQIPLANLDLAQLKVGKEVIVKVLRAGKEVQLKLNPTTRQPATKANKELTPWGFTVANLSDEQMKDPNLKEGAGVSVTGVANGSPSSEAQPAIRPGDVIVKVGDQSIKNVDALLKWSSKIKTSEHGTPTLVEFLRDGQRLLTIVNVDRLPSEDRSIEVAHPWLPVETQVLTPPLLNALQLPDGTRGVRITRIYNLAQKSGLKVGDIITSVDGLPVEATLAEDINVFSDLIEQYRIGAKVNLAGFREGKPLVLEVQLQKAKTRKRDQPVFVVEGLGFSLRETAMEDQDETEDVQGGVVATDVVSGSWGSLVGLNNDDLILQIDGVAVESLEQAKKKLNALKAAKAARIVLFIRRGTNTSFIEVRTNWPQP